MPYFQPNSLNAKLGLAWVIDGSPGLLGILIFLQFKISTILLIETGFPVPMLKYFYYLYI